MKKTKSGITRSSTWKRRDRNRLHLSLFFLNHALKFLHRWPFRLQVLSPSSFIFAHFIFTLAVTRACLNYQMTLSYPLLVIELPGSLGLSRISVHPVSCASKWPNRDDALSPRRGNSRSNRVRGWCRVICSGGNWRTFGFLHMVHDTPRTSNGLSILSLVRCRIHYFSLFGSSFLLIILNFDHQITLL